VTGPAGARLVALIGAADAANQGTTPEEAVADAVHEALLAQPVLRTCLVPGCMRQYDARSRLTGEQPPRPDWSGDGWHTLGMGSIFPAGGVAVHRSGGSGRRTGACSRGRDRS
jgi:hypothetical protein